MCSSDLVKLNIAVAVMLIFSLVVPFHVADLCAGIGHISDNAFISHRQLLSKSARKEGCKMLIVEPCSLEMLQP